MDRTANTSARVNVLDVLPNGATVLDIQPTAWGDFYVLAVWKRGAVTSAVDRHEYITWAIAPDDKGSFVCEYGHYHRTLAAAVADLHARTSQA